jgi:hypothetical protein
LNPGDIPVVATNRGGQVTYHGPGQVVAYPLLDLQRMGYFVKEYVYRLEDAVIRTLDHFGVTGHRVAGAPGIYVRLDDPRSHARLEQRPSSARPAARARPDFTGLGKIAALGIKVSRHCTYHGWRSTSIWTWNPTCASTLAATQGCPRWTFLQSAYRQPGTRPPRAGPPAEARLAPERRP